MRTPDPDLDWLLFTQSGVLTYRQALVHLSPAAVRHRVSSGRWRRVCQGVFVAGPGTSRFDQHVWVAVLAAGDGALLAGLAAARAGGLRGRWRREAIDVLLPAGRKAPDLLRRLPLDLAAVKVRRTTVLTPAERQRGRPDRTTMPRAVVDAAQWAPDDNEARTVVVSACQQRLVLPSELLAVTSRMPRARRRALVITTALDAAGGAGSLAEIDLVRLCARHRLPRPNQQHRRTDAAGRTRYVDAYWRQFGVHAEVDGAHHTDPVQWEADMRRQNDIWIAGDRILRFSAAMVRSRPGEVADQLGRALTAAGWRGPKDGKRRI
ncbi:endonuclease domain-containing protein [Asanoa siamensis]|uniref:endonuclease domain-containing protein n=1 Tax=Asanoa siamensis TaxID=926357 RepID=UPI001EF28BBF|nr:endonuclease domain-containing protein [Asanoa siamensis]